VLLRSNSGETAIKAAVIGETGVVQAHSLDQLA
jgi:hypothetical protein